MHKVPIWYLIKLSILAPIAALAGNYEVPNTISVITRIFEQAPWNEVIDIGKCIILSIRCCVY